MPGPKLDAGRKRSSLFSGGVSTSDHGEISGGHMPSTQAETLKKAKTKSADKKAEATKKAGSKLNALQRPLKPSVELAEVVGAGPLPRGEVVGEQGVGLHQV
jgi:chromatin remodeling complex protein RSC6